MKKSNKAEELLIFVAKFANIGSFVIGVERGWGVKPYTPFRCAAVIAKKIYMRGGGQFWTKLSNHARGGKLRQRNTNAAGARCPTGENAEKSALKWRKTQKSTLTSSSVKPLIRGALNWKFSTFANEVDEKKII